MIQIKNTRLQKALEKVGLGDVLLYRDNGYFFIASDNVELADRIATLNSSSIYMNSFGQQTIADWVRDIQYLFNQKN